MRDTHSPLRQRLGHGLATHPPFSLWNRCHCQSRMQVDFTQLQRLMVPTVPLTHGLARVSADAGDAPGVAGFWRRGRKRTSSAAVCIPVAHPSPDPHKAADSCTIDQGGQCSLPRWILATAGLRRTQTLTRSRQRVSGTNTSQERASNGSMPPATDPSAQRRVSGWAPRTTSGTLCPVSSLTSRSGTMPPPASRSITPSDTAAAVRRSRRESRRYPAPKSSRCR